MINNNNLTICLLIKYILKLNLEKNEENKNLNYIITHSLII